MRRLALAALLAAALAPAATAQAVGLSVRGGTLGVGGGVALGVAPGVNVRATANALAFRQSSVFDGADFDADGLVLDVDAELGMGSVGLLVDWHPLGSTLRVTAGALYNLNGVTAVVRAAEPYYSADLDREFSVERVGTLEARLSYDQPLAPYVGLGLGDLTAGRFGLAAELGVAYVGAPSVEMTGTGLIGGTADPVNVATLEAGLESFRIHPVASLGLKTSFGR